MRKIVLSLALFSSLAIGISLRGQGKENQSCGTFAKCFSEILPNPGSGGGNSGGGGGNGGLPPPYDWKPVFTDAQFQIFCDANRVNYLPKYDPNYVTNNGGILCFDSYRKFYPYPKTQKSPNFIVGGKNGVSDYYSGVNQIVFYGPVYHLENIDGFKFYFINTDNKKLYIYDYRNGTATPTNISGFEPYYHSQVKLYCDKNYNKTAIGAIRVFIRENYIKLAHKCSGEWEPLTISWTNYGRNIYGIYNHGFVIRKHILLSELFSYKLKAVSLDKIGECIQNSIQNSTSRCSLNYSTNTKEILDLSGIREFIYSKTRAKPELYYAFPDINDGGFVVAGDPSNRVRHYPAIVTKEGYGNTGVWFFYGYFETDNNLKVTKGYIASLAYDNYDSYKLDSEKDNYCVYKYTDERGFTSTITFNKVLTNDECPGSIGSFYYNYLYILASNRGTLLVRGTIKINRKDYTFLGILYPDTSQVDGYYLTKIPFYPGSVLKIYMLGVGRGFELIRVNGKDYIHLGVSNLLLYSPQFNRSDADAERY